MKKIMRVIASLLAMVLVITGMGFEGISLKAASYGYTVTFMRDGIVVATTNVEVGSRITSVPDLTKTTEIGGEKTEYYWSGNGNMYKENQLPGITVDQNMTFTETNVVTQPPKKYTLKFNYNGSTVYQEDVEEGTWAKGDDGHFSFDAPNGGPANSYFQGWCESIGEGFNGPWMNNQFLRGSVWGDTTYIPLFTYEIIFDAVRSGDTNYYTVEAGKIFDREVEPAPKYDESKRGSAAVGKARTFQGWYTGPGGTGTRVSTADNPNNISMTPTNHVKLYAHWGTQTSGNFNVTLKVKGYSGATEDIVFDNVAKDAVFLSFPNATKPGFDLVGWNTKDDGSGEAYIAEDLSIGKTGTKITGDLTLYPIFAVRKYNVEFTYRTEKMDIAEPDRENTALNLIYPKAYKELKSISYGSLISQDEAPKDVARTIKQKFIAPDSKNLEKNIEYTVTCTYEDTWKTAATDKKWNFATDTVSDKMIAAEGKDLRPSYAKAYEPYAPPEGYLYDEVTIFELPSHSVKFKYDNDKSVETVKEVKPWVEYGRKVPVSQIPNDVLRSYSISFYDRIAKDSEEYIEYTATYTYGGQWSKENLWHIWDFNNEIVTQDVTLRPVYSVNFEPFAPPFEMKEGEEWNPEDPDAADKLEKYYLKATFDHNNSSNMTTTCSVPKDKAMDDQIAPKVKKSGYRFVGWSRDSKGTTMFDWTEVITADVMLYAIWVKEIDISFNSDGGDYISVETIALGEKANKPAKDPVKEKHVFTGWSKLRQKGKASTECKLYNFDNPVEASELKNGVLKLYAWYKTEEKVWFYYNKASNDETYLEVEIPEAGEFPAIEPKAEEYPEGKVFDGWYTERNGGNKVTATEFKPVPGEVMKVYAHWRSGYQVTYVIEEGTRRMVPYSMDQKAQPLDRPNKGDQMITGWYMDDKFTQAVVWDSIRTDTIVYAKWEAIKKEKTTIIFDSNGGSFTEGETIKKEVTAGVLIPESSWPVLPTHKTKGLIFGGWSLDASGTRLIDSKNYYPTSSQITVYAKWVYEVSFDLGGKATKPGIPNQYVCPNQKVIEPEDVESDKYIFTGWKTKDSDTFWNMEEDVVTGPIVLYAVWEVQVQYDCNGGYFEGNVSLEAQIDEKGNVIKIKKNPVYKGKEFAGWFQDEFGLAPFYFANDKNPTKVNGSTKIYAKWLDIGGSFQIYIEGGKASHYSAEEGKRIAVIARVPDGKNFIKWGCNDLGVIFNKPDKTTTTFIMPERNVSIWAIFEDIEKPDADDDKDDDDQDDDKDDDQDDDKDDDQDDDKDDDKDDDQDDDKDHDSDGGFNVNIPNRPSVIVPDEKPQDKKSSNCVNIEVSANKSGAAVAKVESAELQDAIETAILSRELDRVNDEKAEATVGINLNEKKKATKVTLKLSEESIKMLTDADIDSLEIGATKTKLCLDKEAISEISDQTTGTVSVVMEKNTKEKLPSAAKKAIGGRSAYDINIKYNKLIAGKTQVKKLSKLDKGKMEVQIPYTLTKSEKKGGKDKVYAIYVDTKGKSYYVKNSKYDEDKGAVVIATNQLNTYGITYRK